MRMSFDDDPLTFAMRAPRNETPADRARREREEAEAKQRSLEIDELLRADAAARRKSGDLVKLLLLG